MTVGAEYRRIEALERQVAKLEATNTQLRAALQRLADAVAADWSIMDTTPAKAQAEIFLNVSAAMVVAREVLQ